MLLVPKAKISPPPSIKLNEVDAESFIDIYEPASVLSNLAVSFEPDET